MQTFLLNDDLFLLAAGAFILSNILFPLFIGLFNALRLVDAPGGRKQHRIPVPSIGGLVIFITVWMLSFVSAPLQQLFLQYKILGICLVLLSLTGVLDDHVSLPALFRLSLQLVCAWMLVDEYGGIYSLHGIFGVYELPLWAGNGLSILIITGVTNAYNLLDGIDGLAGGVALVNFLLLGVVAILLGDVSWLFLLLPAWVALFVFLRFNWGPARVFMGDGGSVVLGFLIAFLSMQLLEHAYQVEQHIPAKSILLLLSAASMLPAVDTLRLFYVRMRSGHSPFSADTNHLHHWLLRYHLSHRQVSTRLLSLHVSLIVISYVLSIVLPLSIVLILQAITVLCYCCFLRAIHLLYRWYRLIRRMEANNTDWLEAGLQ